jgi:hypothetical protein
MKEIRGGFIMTTLFAIVLFVIFGAPIIVMMMGLVVYTNDKVREVDLETEEDLDKIRA